MVFYVVKSRFVQTDPMPICDESIPEKEGVPKIPQINALHRLATSRRTISLRNKKKYSSAPFSCRLDR